eukprot:TRINITY_DN23381_c0_g1_i1.p1 TRINITY_DN23381_c0_g1~~TRINITY_DN23381_c0_g1_i1.p1  ORF type:complete len:537 (-),score=51.34 TRINITY_DN23381_c0_g1_i1:116-1726(-)
MVSRFEAPRSQRLAHLSVEAEEAAFPRYTLSPSSPFSELLKALQLAHEDEINSILRTSAPLAPEEGIDVRLPESTSPFFSTRAPSGDGEGNDASPVGHKRLLGLDEPRSRPEADSQRDSSALEAPPTTPKRSHGLGHVRSRGRSSSESFLYRLVGSEHFDGLFALLILANALMMAFEVQYSGYEIGYLLEYKWHSRGVEERYAGMDVVLSVLSWVFGVGFILETLLKAIVWRRMFLRDPWNWFDSIVNCIFIFSKIKHDILPLNSTFLRIARLARLLRLLRLVRKIQGLDALFVITTAMQNCVSTLFWAVVFLGLVNLMISLFVSEFLQEYYFLSTVPAEDQKAVFEYFGTFARTFITMIEITLGNWPPACRIIAEHVSEWFFLFGMMHKVIIGFAIVAVINGVFMQETFNVSAMDDVIMVRRKELATKYHMEKMSALWKEAHEGSGEITLEEWVTLLKDPTVMTWLSSMELDARDAALVFELIDESGDGQISFKELVRGVNKLKGGAKSMDLVYLHREHQEVKRLISVLQQALLK